MHDPTPEGFPFAAIVGQPQLKTALLLCAVDATLGGVLIRGDKGTAKSTAARALAEVLPPIERVSNCAFNCAPGAPCPHCTACGTEASAQPSRVPFVTLPLGATEDRVLGTLDLERALRGAERAFQPGLLAAAHRGILYVDEVNLLPDHLVDVLLDVAAMGVNSVQREGLSIVHPARFTLIGTMNPEEGDLRPQLLDRFGLMVDVAAPRDRSVRAEVVRRRLAFEADAAAFTAAWRGQQQALRARLAAGQALLPTVALDDSLVELAAHLCCELEVDSLRADIVLLKAARAHAALEGRPRATAADMRVAAELVLPHRRRRRPFEQPGLDRDRLDELMGHAEHSTAPPSSSPPSSSPPSLPPSSSSPLPPDSAPDEVGSGDVGRDDAASDSGSGPAEQSFSAAASGPLPLITVDSPTGRDVAGRRSQAPQAARGRVVRAVADSAPTSLAVGATLRSAVLRDPTAAQVTRADLHQQIRTGSSANLILLAVDASGSMAAQRRMQAVKGAVLALLTDAYQRRDEVAVIAFRGDRATLLLPPTRSVDRAEQDLRELPTGGRTPLPHALCTALELLQRRGAQAAAPLLVVLSDGRANVALTEGGDPWRDTLALAGQLAAQGIAALVLDTETGYLRLGRAGQLAQALGAPCLTLEQLSAEQLALTIRSQLRRA